MKDPRIAQYAELLVNYSMAVKKDDKVMIRGNLGSAPLLEELARYVLRAGGRPYVWPTWTGLQRITLLESSDDQLAQVNDLDKALLQMVDCAIHVSAPENTKALTSVDPRRGQIRSRAMAPYMSDYINRVRWVACNYPSEALAQEAEMSVEEYADFLFGACLIDWSETRSFMSNVKEVFDGADKVRIVGPETDLTFSLKGRKGTICAGDRNMPDGEVFYSPLEDTANGYITYDFPAIYAGREVDGVRLEFRDGKVVRATARKGEEFLNQVLDTDEGARYIGEFGIGCNFGITRFTKDILFDEKIGGTIHIAVGRSYEESGGTIKSAVHWDMIKDLRREGRLEVDGKVVQENGKFVGL